VLTSVEVMTDQVATIVEPRHHLLIAGQGRSGTTLLVKVLSACGLQTHLEARGDEAWYSTDANAGLEDQLSKNDAPYVVKSPLAYQELQHLLERGRVVIDHAIVPVRRLRDAAASRVITEIQDRISTSHDPFSANTSVVWDHVAATAGGIVYSLEPIDQERILATGFTRLIELLVAHEIPTTFLDFPRFTHDVKYLYGRIAPIISEHIGWSEFSERVAKVIDPDLVHVETELDAIALNPEADRPNLDDLAQIGARRALAAVISERDALREGRARTSREHEEAARRWEEQRTKLRDQVRGLAAKLERTENEVRSIRAKYQSQLARNRSLTARTEALTSENRSVVADRQAIADRIAAIEGSRSWRWTSPLRGGR
jgi:hypothetical protein